MKEADKNQKPYKGETVNDLYLIVKKLSQGDVKKAVVRIKDGGPRDYYTFDLTRPLEENRKILKLLKTVKSTRSIGINKHTELNSCTPNVGKQC